MNDEDAEAFAEKYELEGPVYLGGDFNRLSVHEQVRRVALGSVTLDELQVLSDGDQAFLFEAGIDQKSGDEGK